ncbi:uncharacterized protein JCM15063_005077 [Sporobolomyces koalae]|uniref:uncharacterized protein n=1 Tax=Sporobolomyces koalae TaxID=500713 RepID=UPI00317499AE
MAARKDLQPWLRREWLSERNELGPTLRTDAHTNKKKKLQYTATLGETVDDDGEALIWIRMSDTELEIQVCVPKSFVQAYNDESALSLTASSEQKDLFTLQEWKFHLASPPTLQPHATAPLPKAVCLKIIKLQRYGDGPGQVINHNRLVAFRRDAQVGEMLDAIERPQQQLVQATPQIMTYDSELPAFAPKTPEPALGSTPTAKNHVSSNTAGMKDSTRTPTTVLTSASTTETRRPRPSAAKYDWSLVWPLDRIDYSVPARSELELEELWRVNKLNRIQDWKKRGKKIDPKLEQSLQAVSTHQGGAEGAPQAGSSTRAVKAETPTVTVDPRSRPRSPHVVNRDKRAREPTTSNPGSPVKILPERIVPVEKKLATKEVAKAHTQQDTGTTSAIATVETQGIATQSAPIHVDVETQISVSPSSSSNLIPQSESKDSEVDELASSSEDSDASQDEEDDVEKALLSVSQYSQHRAKRLRESSAHVSSDEDSLGTQQALSQWSGTESEEEGEPLSTREAQNARKRLPPGSKSASDASPGRDANQSRRSSSSPMTDDSLPQTSTAPPRGPQRTSRNRPSESDLISTSTATQTTCSLEFSSLPLPTAAQAETSSQLRASLSKPNRHTKDPVAPAVTARVTSAAATNTARATKAKQDAHLKGITREDPVEIDFDKSREKKRPRSPSPVLNSPQAPRPAAKKPKTEPTKSAAHEEARETKSAVLEEWDLLVAQFAAARKEREEEQEKMFARETAVEKFKRMSATRERNEALRRDITF